MNERTNARKEKITPKKNIVLIIVIHSATPLVLPRASSREANAKRGRRTDLFFGSNVEVLLCPRGVAGRPRRTRTRTRERRRRPLTGCRDSSRGVVVRVDD